MWEHFYLPQPSYLHYVCYPESCGRYYLDPEHRVRRQAGTLKEYNLHVVVSGKGFVITGGKRQELTAGSGFLYGPGECQDYGTSPDDPWDVRWVHFAWNGIEPLFSGKGLGEVWLFALAQQRNRVEQALEKLTRMSEAFESTNEPAISAALYEALAALMHHAGRQRRLAGRGTHEKMFEVADYIRAGCSGKLDLTSIAGKAGYSPYHFTRIFREAIGKSPTQYLTECRILLAKNLLVSTPLAVKQIAYETGFSQCSYFISLFHQMTGMTPRQFRDLYR
ncbi:AraC family transcriptional regulator [Paenibacillus tarimensis]